MNNNIPEIEIVMPNMVKLLLHTVTLYFSYNTVIAYRDRIDGLVIRKNDWSTTTGKHLNWLSEDKKIRISGDVFEEMLEKVIARHIV